MKKVQLLKELEQKMKIRARNRKLEEIKKLEKQRQLEEEEEDFFELKVPVSPLSTPKTSSSKRRKKK